MVCDSDLTIFQTNCLSSFQVKIAYLWWTVNWSQLAQELNLGNFFVMWICNEWWTFLECKPFLFCFFIYLVMYKHYDWNGSSGYRIIFVIEEFWKCFKDSLLSSHDLAAPEKNAVNTHFAVNFWCILPVCGEKGWINRERWEWKEWIWTADLWEECLEQIMTVMKQKMLHCRSPWEVLVKGINATIQIFWNKELRAFV